MFQQYQPKTVDKDKTDQKDSEQILETCGLNS